MGERHGYDFYEILLVVERGRVDALVGKFLELGYDTRPVFLVSYAEPMRWCGKYLCGSLSGLDHAVDCVRDVELLLGLIDVLFKECVEDFLALLEIVRSEASHVH